MQVTKARSTGEFVALRFIIALPIRKKLKEGEQRWKQPIILS